MAGIQAGRALGGWRRGVGVGRGHRSRCFLSVGERGWVAQGVFDDRDEWIGDLSLPPFLTPPFSDMCQSVPVQYGDPALLPIRHVLPRQGLAALRGTVHQHESFSPPPPAKCVGHQGINETLWVKAR